MQLVSVNVSPGRIVHWRGREVATGIFKEPVSGRVALRRFNLDGDRQADPSVHGGEFKAVYAYAVEHYEWWRRELGRELAYGMFGENLTIEEFPEDEIGLGDRFRIGSALLEAVQPRLPCFKLGIRFGDARMVKRFMQSGRFGIYFRVVEEGEVGAGDIVICTYRDPVRFPVPVLVRLLDPSTRDPALVRRALELAALPPNWAQTLRMGGDNTGEIT